MADGDVTRRSFLATALATGALTAAPGGSSLLLAREQSEAPWSDSDARWITCPTCDHSQPNQWLCYRTSFELAEKPGRTPVSIATDSRYWLWVNGDLAVWEGQLKRGPTPEDTYYDRIDIAPHLQPGRNTIAILQWYFGKEGFSHNSSGKAGLLLDGRMGDTRLQSDASWKTRMHPAFGDTGKPKPNYRLPEPNIRYDGARKLEGWEKPDFDDSGWQQPETLGKPGDAPWNRLVRRPIPQWKTSGIRDYENASELGLPRTSEGEKLVCDLPYDAHVTPYLKVRAPRGKTIDMRTDAYRAAGPPSVRAEYVTREGVQEYENPGWMSGHKVHYTVPAGVELLDLGYRESGYDVDFAGAFECSDDLLNGLWKKGRRTVYVNMRDTYYDCPERERAQWWGDVVNELAESFYIFGRKSDHLTRKGILELIDWQRDDGTIFSPIPAGNWNKELPTQMLNSVGYFGFWTYYKYTGDAETIRAVYPGVRRYMSVWKQKSDGLVKRREGDWTWVDWGENKDQTALFNLWFYLGLMGQRNMARACGFEDDVPAVEKRMKALSDGFNDVFWTGSEYRSPDYEGETDDRTQALAVLAGLAEEEMYGDITKILQNEYHASPYMERYVLEALCRMRRPGLAVERMKKRYRPMVEHRLSTLWEHWKEGQGSYNHGWSGGPLIVMSQYLAGIAPDRPGFKEYHVMPQMGPIERIRTTVPSVRGKIEADMRQGDGSFSMKLTSPSGTRARVGVPKDPVGPGAAITVNGTTVWKDGERAGDVEGLSRSGENRRYHVFIAKPGKWTFRATS